MIHGTRRACLPEIRNNVIALCVSSIVRVFLPVFNIDIGNTPNQQLQLTLVENVYQISWYQVVETVDKGFELLLHSLLNTPTGDKAVREKREPVSVSLKQKIFRTNILNIFPLVIVCDLDILAIRLQVDSHSLTKSAIFC